MPTPTEPQTGPNRQPATGVRSPRKRARKPGGGANPSEVEAGTAIPEHVSPATIVAATPEPCPIYCGDSGVQPEPTLSGGTDEEKGLDASLTPEPAEVSTNAVVGAEVAPSPSNADVVSGVPAAVSDAVEASSGGHDDTHSTPEHSPESVVRPADPEAQTETDQTAVATVPLEPSEVESPVPVSVTAECSELAKCRKTQARKMGAGTKHRRVRLSAVATGEAAPASSVKAKANVPAEQMREFDISVHLKTGALIVGDARRRGVRYRVVIREILEDWAEKHAKNTQENTQANNEEKLLNETRQ